ncbi:MAG: hypothetical protein IJ806_00825 [Ruminococcus sp.]|nr:hypothetical protein [Ruminococcus sp.]
MKKFSDAITVAAFLMILLMFALSTVFFQNNASFAEVYSDCGSVSETVQEFVRLNFPMSSNWRNLYASLLVNSGRVQFDNIYLAGDRLVKLDDEDRSERIAANVEQINDFAEGLDQSLYIMLCPTAAGIYRADLPAYVSQNDQKERINNVYMMLDKKIVSIDAFYPLYSARDEYVYYRTEDLWTPFGAYYAYCESVRQLGLKAQKMDNYDQEYAISSFTGSLYSKAMYEGIAPDRINIFRSKYQSPVTSVELFDGDESRTAESVYFRSALKTSAKTDVFLLGDRYERVDVKTDLEGSPSLLIIKGSYANTLVPFYTPHFSRITVVDPARLKKNKRSLSDVVDLSEYDQILIMFDIDSFSKNSSFDVL